MCGGFIVVFRGEVEPSMPPSPLYVPVDDIHIINVLLLEYNIVFNITN